MNILVLGGTGAMGRPLVEMLSKKNSVYVTSRSSHSSAGNVTYCQGNAQNKSFLLKTLSTHHWDAVVDFMVWPEAYFKEVLPHLLDSTRQYIYISSARVYAECQGLITEDSPRLLDVSEDREYLKTNEYALAKAREENLLKASGRTNYTIVRPSITYNAYRLQLGVLEKENWLYRALHGRTIVFSHDIAGKLTTMTCGDDVARGIASLVGQKEALGEAFHITYPASLPWSEVLGIYLQVLEEHLGRKIPVLLTEKSTNFMFPRKVYQLVYSRYFNRTFDNSKIARFCDVQGFVKPQEGLASCLHNFLEAPRFSRIDWKLEAVNDKVCGEKTPLHEISSRVDKVYYLLYRYDLKWLRVFVEQTIVLLKKLRNVIK